MKRGNNLQSFYFAPFFFFPLLADCGATIANTHRESLTGERGEGKEEKRRRRRRREEGKTRDGRGETEGQKQRTQHKKKKVSLVVIVARQAAVSQSVPLASTR